MGYAAPVSAGVSCDWACHRNRNPPSSEPGTDYACAYGTPVAAPWSGVVTYTQTHPGGATGRYCEIALDDGRTARGLHLASVSVGVGQRVSRGQHVAVSGASGYGSDWYYGPHQHQTLWPGAAWAAPTIDFELYVGADEPAPAPPDDDEGEEDVALKGLSYKAASGTVVYMLFNEVSGFFIEHSGVQGSYNNSIAGCWATGSWPSVTEAHAKGFKSALTAIQVQDVTGTLRVDIPADAAADAVALAAELSA